MRSEPVFTVSITPADAIEHSLTPVSIRAEPGAAGMAAELFPGVLCVARVLDSLSVEVARPDRLSRSVAESSE